ncbi:MAG: zinc ribbon domain-containing protein [Candidatus Bathyarchaeota archaeon]|nr:zinc ribbon domain-containing protein [Candidatus Bathyarchaeota archaeon]
MAFCIKCGKEIPEGAEFCPNCGTQIASTEKSEKNEYLGIGGTLILIGGILAIIFSFFSIIGATYMSYWGGMMGGWSRMPHMMGRWGMPMIFGDWILGLAIGAIISIILGILAIYVYGKIRAGEVRSGGTIAIVIGIIMLVTMNWLPGFVTLIGGILCYTSK